MIPLHSIPRENRRAGWFRDNPIYWPQHQWDEYIHHREARELDFYMQETRRQQPLYFPYGRDRDRDPLLGLWREHHPRDDRMDTLAYGLPLPRQREMREGGQAEATRLRYEAIREELIRFLTRYRPVRPLTVTRDWADPLDERQR